MTNQPNVINRILERILSIGLSHAIPKAYRAEAIELMKEDDRTTVLVLIDYVVGAINYRFRRLWIPVMQFLIELFESIPIDGKQPNPHGIKQ